MSKSLWLPNPGTLVIGIDEAGRGCWAGPVVAGATLFKTSYLEAYQKTGGMGELSKLNDSKKLTHQQRSDLVAPIHDACYWGVGEASHLEIDHINILQATFLAMQRALEALIIRVQKENPSLWKTCFSEQANQHPLIQVDGKLIPPLQRPGWTIEAIVQGDGQKAPIAAASILAKEYRDDLLVKLDSVYPGYGFGQHKSYGTQAHMEALQKLGPCAIHRKTFKPIAKLLKKA